MNTKPKSHAIAFIGGGNMARSLIGGLIRNGTPPKTISVSEPNAELRAALARDFSVAVHAENAAAAKSADVLVLAVKPQVMKTVCAGLRDIAQARRPLIVSIAAGIRIDQLDAWLDGDLAWAQGTYEYRPLGAAVISANDLFRRRDFSPRRKALRPGSIGYAGQYASIGHLNAELQKRRRGKRARQRAAGAA